MSNQNQRQAPNGPSSRPSISTGAPGGQIRYRNASLVARARLHALASPEELGNIRAALARYGVQLPEDEEE